tara:strand:- start:54 stop:1031 length:978 start_codon:yes stop_codon:yes gene_type:complete
MQSFLKSRIRVALGALALGVVAASAFAVYIVHAPSFSRQVQIGDRAAASTPSSPEQPASEGPRFVSTARGNPNADAAFVATLPGQFQGTRVDGELVPSRALRDLFDYFLSGIGRYRGHDQQAAARQNLARYSMMQNVSTEARSQLLRLFDQYLRLQNRLADESRAFADTDLATRLSIVRDMRRAELGPAVAEAFYGDDEAETAAAIARQAAGAERPQDAGDKTLVAAARIETARNDGASDADITRMRREAFGPEAQARLATLDTQRRIWRKRYDTYAGERDAVLASAMSTGDRNQALAALRARFFDNAAERRRAAALDRIAAQTK